MVHIDISENTKTTLNHIKGLMQAQDSKDLLTYDKVVTRLCLLYLERETR